MGWPHWESITQSLLTLTCAHGIGAIPSSFSYLCRTRNAEIAEMLCRGRQVHYMGLSVAKLTAISYECVADTRPIRVSPGHRGGLNFTARSSTENVIPFSRACCACNRSFPDPDLGIKHVPFVAQHPAYGGQLAIQHAPLEVAPGSNVIWT